MAVCAVCSGADKWRSMSKVQKAPYRRRADEISRQCQQQRAIQRTRIVRHYKLSPAHH